MSCYNNIYHINNLYISISFKVYIMPSINIQLEDLIFSGVSSIKYSLRKSFHGSIFQKHLRML